MKSGSQANELREEIALLEGVPSLDAEGTEGSDTGLLKRSKQLQKEPRLHS
jgi:hypothetical protein